MVYCSDDPIKYYLGLCSSLLYIYINLHSYDVYMILKDTQLYNDTLVNKEGLVVFLPKALNLLQLRS
jgi:hypothetical protein